MEGYRKENSKTSSEDRDKRYQESLARIIKGTHAELRNKFKTKKEEYMKIWEDHCKDENSLAVYANAMYHLANDIWTKRPNTRIEWCHETIINFFHNGGLEKVIAKERRRREFNEKRKGSSSQGQDIKSVDFRPNAENDALGDSHPNSTWSAPSCGKIHLLDVGSCFNPFANFPEFESIGIDISPAVPNVYRCDFVRVPTITQESLGDCTIGHLLEPKDKISLDFLPKESFHTVVFSLLLEYMPSFEQRWTCVQKAHKLLTINGLLLIITPDSHHQNKNVHMMKSWKQSIEAVGFQRYCYEKQQHLHCMAYRKTSDSEHIKLSCEEKIKFAEGLYIPQDRSNKHENIDNEVEDSPTSIVSDNSSSNERSLDNTEILYELPLFVDE